MMMGQLKDPMLREKYTRAELIDIVVQYKELLEEIATIKDDIRETTFKVEEDTLR